MATDCIVLNKPFRGSYLNDDEHEAHEIINFFQTDKHDHFIYNNPYGQNVRDAANCHITYMVYTSEMQKDCFYILYVCKIKKSLHNQSISKKKLSDSNYLKKITAAAKNEIEKNLPKKYGGKLENVTYDGVPLTDFFHDNSYAIPLTFTVSEMYQAIKPILIDTRTKANDGTKNLKDVYHFQRNYGYVQKEGKSGYVYQTIVDEIKQNKEKRNLIPFPIGKFHSSTHTQSQLTYHCLAKTTFLDFIDSTRLEEAYTKMIANLFNSVPGLFESFLSTLKPQDMNGGNIPVRFKKDGSSLSNKTPHDGCYPVLSEVTIPYVGRLDLFYTNHDQNVVIENKIDSLLTENHGIQDNPEKETDDEAKKEKDKMRGRDQLSRYYLHFSQYAKGEKKTLYFLLAPETRFDILRQDMNNKNPDLLTHYQFIGYRFLEEFLKLHEDELNKGEFRDYLDDALCLMRRLSLTDKERCEIKLAINANKASAILSKVCGQEEK